MVFVTGSTGFIGTSLVRELVSRGEQVRALCRRPSPPQQGVDVVLGDLCEPGDVLVAMQGCTRVYHLAAHARAGGPTEPYEAINVGGTQNVVSAALQLGCERLVFTSTAATLGPSGAAVNDEQDVKEGPWFTPYEETKRRAEDLVLASGIGLVVHPSRVFGPGPLTQSNSLTRLIDLYRRGWFRISLARGAPIGNYVFVRDVVDGHLAAMAGGRLGERYLIGGENRSLGHLLALVGECTGRQRRLIPLPASWARRLAGVEEVRARWMGSDPAISVDHVDRFLANYAFRSEKAARELGYQPRSLRQGILETLAWLDA